MKKFSLIDLILSCILGMWIIVMFTLIFIVDQRYKRGQIDALNGQVEYELVIQSDSTRTWELIKTD